jgi:hypothetical protein
MGKFDNKAREAIDYSRIDIDTQMNERRGPNTKDKKDTSASGNG